MEYARFYRPDRARLDAARARQAAVFNHEKPDTLPIFLNAPLTDEQEGLPDPDFQEAFYDVEMMFCQQLRMAIETLNSGSDSVPSIRANTGTGTALSCLGLEQEIFPDKMPWLKRHMTKNEISALEPDDIKIQGTMERVLEYMKLFKECLSEVGLDDALPLYVPDQQGPFDLAHMLMGDEIFLAIYDDPPFVRHLMEICLELGIRVTRWAKEISGEAETECYHSNWFYSNNLGLRICEDTSVMIGEEHMREFVIPYTARLAREFGGAWVHYCGRNDTLTRLCCELPEIRAINFGIIPGKEHEHHFETEMELCQETGTVSITNWPRRDNESGKEYLDRMHGWAKTNCIIPIAGAALGENGFASTIEACDYWYALG